MLCEAAMTDRSKLERRLIDACNNLLDATMSHDSDAEAMAVEVMFARRVLMDWQSLGAKEAFSRAAAFMELGDRWRTQRGTN